MRLGTAAMTGNQPAAAWYADPSNPSQLRWWNGTGWTADVAAVPTSPMALAENSIEAVQVEAVQVEVAPVVPVVTASVVTEPTVAERAAAAPFVPAPVAAAPFVRAPDAEAPPVVIAALGIPAVATPEPAEFVPAFTPVEPIPAVAPNSVQRQGVAAGGFAEGAIGPGGFAAASTAPRIEPTPTFAPGAQLPASGAPQFAPANGQHPQHYLSADGQRYAPAHGRDYAPSFGQQYAPAYAPVLVEPEVAEQPWGSPQTFPVWLFAFAPIWFAFGFYFLTNLMRFLPNILVAFVAWALMSAILIRLAVVDNKRLVSRGYRRTSSWWTLLLPVFLAIRLSKTGRRGVGPLITFIVVQLSIWTIGALIVLPSFMAGLQYGVTHSRVSTGQGQTPPQPTPQGEDFAQIVRPMAISPEQRKYELTPAGMESAIRNDALDQGFEVNILKCDPLPSTVDGSTTQCHAQISRVDMTLTVIVQSTRSDAAFQYLRLDN